MVIMNTFCISSVNILKIQLRTVYLDSTVNMRPKLITQIKGTVNICMINWELAVLQSCL